MKKRQLLFGAALLVSGLGYSQQQITNGGFEDWENIGTGDEEPVSWSNMQTGDLCGLCAWGASQRAFLDNTESRPGSSGSTSVRLENTAAFGNLVNGTITTGRMHAPSTTPSEGFTQTHTGTEGDGNNDWAELLNSSQNPDSVVFWAKYVPDGAGIDEARISVDIHTNYAQANPHSNDPGGNGNTNVDASIANNFTTGGVWIRKSLALDYSAPALSHSNILVTITASSAIGPGSSDDYDESILWVDDFFLVYNVTSTYAAGSHCPGDAITVNWSTNGPTTDSRTFTAELSDENGDFTSPVNIGSSSVVMGISSGTINATLPTSGLVAGSGYKIRVKGNHEGYAAVTGTNSLTISVPTGTTAPVAVTDCTNPDGSVTTTSSGTGFELFNDGDVSQGSNGTGTFGSLDAGDYYIIITEGSCTASTSIFTINNGPAATAGTGASTNATDCTNPDGGIIISGSNGTNFELFNSSDVSQSSNGTGTFTDLTAGDYYVTVSNDCPGSNNTATITVGNAANYTVSITPNAEQNLNISSDGDALTPTESSAASAREWKYSMVSGSGYQSFSPIETGATYTPNFTAIGTYYVICESLINNCTVTSDEVTVNVGDVGITEQNFDESNILFYNNELTINLTSVKSNTASVNILSLDGKLILRESLVSGNKNQKTISLIEGIYFVNVQLDGQTTTKKVYVK